MRAFRLNLDQAELFFSICHELHADTEEERVTILDAMARGGEIDGIVYSPKTKAEYIKHLQKNFKCAIVMNKDDAQQEKSNGQRNSSEHSTGSHN
jgi:hypothetical protein